MTEKIAVVIPARYGSSRLKAKPLEIIAGKTMLQRVFEAALIATADLEHASVIIATDDKRILTHANQLGATSVMTDECATGSDRVLNACVRSDLKADYVINLQGDAPLTPPSFIKTLIHVLLSDPDADIATPVIQLSWKSLETLSRHKLKNPYSGTTVVINKDGYALWFSKQIIPAIRNADQLKCSNHLSPVFQHIGLYGYKIKALKKFVSLAPSYYENLESLEQLRMLENGMRIKTVTVKSNQYPNLPGVDTKEDLLLTEELLDLYGEPMDA